MSALDDLHGNPEHYTLFGALRRIEQVHRDRPRLGSFHEMRAGLLYYNKLLIAT